MHVHVMHVHVMHVHVMHVHVIHVRVMHFRLDLDRFSNFMANFVSICRATLDSFVKRNKSKTGFRLPAIYSVMTTLLKQAQDL